LTNGKVLLGNKQVHGNANITYYKMSEVNGSLLLQIFYSCPFGTFLDIFNLLYHPNAQY